MAIMKKNYWSNKMQRVLIFLLVGFLFYACNDYVQSVDPLIDQVEDERLTDASQVIFLTKGVQQRMATTVALAGMLSGGLSDEMVFDQDVPNATFPTFREIDEGNIEPDNNSIDGLFTNLSEARYFAEDLIRRLGEISDADPEQEREAMYTSYLVSGLMRQYMASYFGLNPTEPGGVINAGPFIPASEMYNLALEQYQLALGKASTDDGGYQGRVVNSLIARVHLLAGNYSSAATFAENGLVSGDEAFSALYTTQSPNDYYFGGGRGRTQWIVDFRFNDYITADPAEANRILIETIEGSSGTIYYRQAAFPEQTSPYPIVTWQEMSLIIAETSLRNNDSGRALSAVNSVRAFYGLGTLSAIDMDTIITERDKTLFLQGHRMMDEKRFNQWHLPTGTWQVLRIGEREINANPNLGG